jgi:hypothetical protein
MTHGNDFRMAHQRKRWLQPDQRRWFTPEAYERNFGSKRETVSPREAARERAFDRELLALRRDHAALRRVFDEVRFALLLRKAGFNSDQPRVPRGNPDGGEWTSEGGGSGLGRVRLAGSDKPRLGRGSLLAIASEFAQRAIEAYRSENGLFDLFRGRTGTVAMTTIDGNIFLVPIQHLQRLAGVIEEKWNPCAAACCKSIRRSWKRRILGEGQTMLCSMQKPTCC